MAASLTHHSEFSLSVQFTLCSQYSFLASFFSSKLHMVYNLLTESVDRSYTVGQLHANTLALLVVASDFNTCIRLKMLQWMDEASYQGTW